MELVEIPQHGSSTVQVAASEGGVKAERGATGAGEQDRCCERVEREVCDEAAVSEDRSDGAGCEARKDAGAEQAPGSEVTTVESPDEVAERQAPEDAGEEQVLASDVAAVQSPDEASGRQAHREASVRHEAPSETVMPERRGVRVDITPLSGLSEDLPIPSFHGLVGRHPSILSIVEVIRRVASTDATVLITGESGTGKELVAEAIHRMSARGRGRFVPVHCGAIPEDLLESEMFGHEKGAFTGAISSRVGRFRLADQGTIFLDEIGEMSPKLQVKLLRVLEDGRVEPVGSVATQQLDVRIIAATNRNLEDQVAARTFREDLYYRLRVVPIEMPPLRRRRDDIPLLIRHFLQQFHAQKGLRLCAVNDAAMEALVQYPWPGNVRELKNILEQILVLGEGDGTISVADLPPHLTASQPLDGLPRAAAPWEFGPRGIDFYREMEIIEDRIIAQALRLSAGNKKEAARLLRVNRTTLLEKLKRKRQQQDGLLGRLLNEGASWSGVPAFGPELQPAQPVVPVTGMLPG